MLGASFQYYFTDRDLAEYERDPAAYADDVPVERKCRWYINNWSEQRFFRYSPKLVWAEGNWPQMGYNAIYPKRIRLKHYQYRSPQQIQRRLDSRRNAPANHFTHERSSDWAASVIQKGSARRAPSAEASFPDSWRERVVDAASLTYDDGKGAFVIDEAALPSIPGLPTAVAGSAKRLAVSGAASVRARMAGRGHGG